MSSSERRETVVSGRMMTDEPGENRTRRIRVYVGAMLILFSAQALLSMRLKSVTVDEIMYIAAGYYHLRTGDFQLNMTNPPLMKVVSAAPQINSGGAWTDSGPGS